MVNLSTRSLEIRKTACKILYQSGASHIGSAMSCVEILNTIFACMDVKKIHEHTEDRDRIILSKGHAAAALFSTYYIYGLLSKKELDTYYTNGTKLAGHPTNLCNLIEHPTGALGHGASVGVGIAYALQIKDVSSKVYVVLGDGELHEGSNWEAFMLSDALELSNLYFLIDYNQLSGVANSQCCGLNNLEKKLKAFGLNTITVNGHSEFEISQAIQTSDDIKGAHAIICKTVKGKGISFAENNNRWHYRPFDKEAYEQAIQELK